jgi:hypothetical protein
MRPPNNPRAHPPNGRRFAVLPRDVVTDEKGSVHVTFVLNFFDELHRRLR